MALITIDRSLFASKTDDGDGTGSSSVPDAPDNSSRSSLSEDFLTCKATVIGLNIHSKRRSSVIQPNDEIQDHLKKILGLLRFGDYIQLIVRLQCEFSRPHRHRYCCVVSTTGKQGTEESIILGVDITDRCATVGLVLPIWQDMSVSLCGDGGFELITKDTEKLFKPVSVQALWAAFQAVDRACSVARSNAYFSRGLTHDWVMYYQNLPLSETYQIQEWLKTDDIDSFNRCVPLLSCLSVNATEEEKETVRIKELVRAKLQEVMYTVDLEEVTVLQLRKRLEEELGISLHAYRHFIEAEVLRIYGQMDESSEIFPHLLLGTTFNASNQTELVRRSVTHILNVTREVDNFFPGEGYQYKNIRVFDDEQSSLLPYFEDAHRFINEAKAHGTCCLVHCKMGISRSASVVIAYTMKEQNMDLDTALAFVKARRHCIQPNPGFMRELRTYEGILGASSNRAIFRQEPTPLAKAIASGQPVPTGQLGTVVPSNSSPLPPGSTSRPEQDTPVPSGIAVPTPVVQVAGSADERLDLESELFVYKQFRRTGDAFEIIDCTNPVDSLGLAQGGTDDEAIQAAGRPHDVVLDLASADEKHRLKDVTIVARNSHCLLQWHPDLVEKVDLSGARPSRGLSATLQPPRNQPGLQRSLSPTPTRQSCSPAAVENSLSLSLDVCGQSQRVSLPTAESVNRTSLSARPSLHQSSASDSGITVGKEDGVEVNQTCNSGSSHSRTRGTVQSSSFVLKMASKLAETSALQNASLPSVTKEATEYSPVGDRRHPPPTTSSSRSLTLKLTTDRHPILTPGRASADLVSTSVNNCLDVPPRGAAQARPMHQRCNSSRFSAPVATDSGGSLSPLSPICRSQSARQATGVSSGRSSLFCRLRPDNSWIVHDTTVPGEQSTAADRGGHKMLSTSRARPQRRLRPKSTLSNACCVSAMNQCLSSSRSDQDMQVSYRKRDKISHTSSPPHATDYGVGPLSVVMCNSGTSDQTSRLTNLLVTTNSSGSSVSTIPRYGISSSNPFSVYQSTKNWPARMLDPVATQSSC